MRIGRIAAITFSLVLTSAAIAQEKTDNQATVSSTVQRFYAAGNVAGFRLVLTRTESGGSEVLTQALETPGAYGRFETTAQTTAETTGIGSDSVTARREVFGKNPDGRLKLLERTDADQQKLQDGTSRITQTTWVPDVNGRLGLSYRSVQETKTTAANLQQTEIIVSLPGINALLRETQRIQQTRRQLDPNLIQIDSLNELRDANGRWQTTETRSQELRTLGPGEVVEEQMVRRLDGNGQITPSERSVTRRSTRNGSSEAVTEIYSADILGLTRSARSRLELNQRVRVTTMTTMSGVTETISDLEARTAGVTNGPLQVIVRTVETVRQVAPDRFEKERRTFRLDGNGRLVQTIEQREETQGKPLNGVPEVVPIRDWAVLSPSF